MSERNPVTYTKEQRKYALEHGKHLVCASALGVTFTGSVDKATAKRMLEWMTENLLKKAAERKEGG